MTRITAIFAVAGIAAAAAAQPALFTNLGDNTQGSDVSAYGTYIARISTLGTFRWSSSGGFLTVGSASISGSQPYVSADGATVVWDRGGSVNLPRSIPSPGTATLVVLSGLAAARKRRR